MKFGQYLLKNLTPEWTSQYIEYDQMKLLIYDSISEADRLIDTSDHARREEYFLQSDEQFFQFCEKEVSKINNFFAEKLAEATRLFQTLKNELEHVDEEFQSQLVADSVMSTLNSDDSSESQRNGDNVVLITSDLSSKGLRSWLRRMKPNRSIEALQRLRMERTHHQRVNNLKLAFSEFYLMLVLLGSYQTLNSNGFDKILKKHDKLMKTNRAVEWGKTNVESKLFYRSHQIEAMKDEVETLYTDSLESGDRTKAMQRLRVPPLEEKQPHIVTFRAGMYVGMLFILIPLVFIMGSTLDESRSGKPLAWREALHLYRFSFLLTLHIVLVGVNMYGWSHAGVNHVLIFEIDPRKHLTYQRVLEIGTFLMVVWFLSFIIFIISSYYDAHPFAQPLVLVLFYLAFLLNPFQVLYYRSRRWFLKNLGRVFLAPFYHVDFTGFWLGDQLISLDVVFFDLQFFICFYANHVNWIEPTEKHGAFCSGWSQLFLQTVFILLPSWFRFAQCLRRYRDTNAKFPHLANAGKYASGFLVAITNTLRRSSIPHYHLRQVSNPFLYLWFISSMIGSIYKLVWDLKMDYGFFDKNAGKNRFLREQIIYSSIWYYYAAIIENIIFRFIWMVNLFVQFDTTAAEYADIFGFAFGVIEVVRRFIWNYFRLENEHLNNCGEFRAVRDISIQAALSVANGYSTRLETIRSLSAPDDERNAKRNHSVLTSDNTLTMPKNRKSITLQEASHYETIALESLPTEINNNQTPNVVLNPSKVSMNISS